MKKNYLVIIERARTGYSAYSPDLPGCVAAGNTRELTEKRMREAVELHLQGLCEDGLEIPEPDSTAIYVAVGA